jgi:hypothetical protein
MKYFPMLKNHAIAAVLSGLVGLVILTTASISHAQTGTEAKGPSTEKRAPSGWIQRDPKNPNNENWLTRTFGSEPEPATPDQPAGWLTSIFGSSPEPATPDQPAGSPPPGWSSAREGGGSCRHSSDEEEDFTCKLIRIFWGFPRTGPQRDQDIEENISVGGAAG